MSGQTDKTGQIVAALQATVAGFDRAGAQLASAVAHAEQVRARMVAAGFHGVALGMTGAADNLKKIHAQAGALADGIRRALAPIREITAEMTPEQVNAKLAVGVEEASTVRTGISGAMEQMAAAKEKISAVLRGGQPGPLLSMIETTRQIMWQTGQHLDSAVQNAREATTEATQAGN